MAQDSHGPEREKTALLAMAMTPWIQSHVRAPVRQKNISSCSTPSFAWQKHKNHARSAVQNHADGHIREGNISLSGDFPFKKCSEMYA